MRDKIKLVLYAFVIGGIASLLYVAHETKKYSAEIDSVEYGLPATTPVVAVETVKTNRAHSELEKLIQIRTQFVLGSKPTER